MKEKILLVAIILLAAVLRFNQLNSLPALNADEAAIGYNAYSLIQTGRDEHGNPWPIHFESFGDYKPGLFFYIVLPFVKVLGLNELAVRIPGALLGVLTVLIVFLLVEELRRVLPLASPSALPPANKHGAPSLGLPGSRHPSLLALLSAFFLAISPWHIHFSRGGWEVNAATFFITLGIWLFLKGLKNSKFYVPSSIFFVLSLYTYHAARIVVPLLGLGLLLLYRKEILKDIGKIVGPAVVGLLLLIPLFLEFSGPAGISRFAGVGLLADPGPLARINEQRGEHGDFKSLPALVFHNKAVNYGLAFAQNWAEHFWGEFLFLTGDEIQRNKVPKTGVLYLFDLPLLVIGLLAIARNPAGWGTVLWWLLVAPVAAALTFQSPHALRAHNMVIPLTIISAFGALSLWEWIKINFAKNNFLMALLLYGFIALIAWNFTRYLHQYYVHMAKEYPFSSQYGVKELVAYVSENQDKYQKIVVTDRYDQPYILFLFYLAYPPQDFQGKHELTARDRFGFSTVRDFDKFHFGVNFDKDKIKYPKALIAGADEEIPDEANIIREIYFPNGKPAFQIVAN